MIAYSIIDKKKEREREGENGEGNGQRRTDEERSDRERERKSKVRTPGLECTTSHNNVSYACNIFAPDNR